MARRLRDEWAHRLPGYYRRVSQSTLALLTVPVVTGVIGYVTNWTGVLMLFYPVHFKGWRVPGLQVVVRVLPHKLQQIPGVMVGGLGGPVDDL
jgi:hypothetical protein